MSGVGANGALVVHGDGVLTANSPIQAHSKPPRVIPLLSHDLKTRGVMQQRMNLLMFKERWHDIHKVRVSQADAEEFLEVLFILINDRNHVEMADEAEGVQRSNVSLLAFESLCLLFNDQHPHFKTFLRALVHIMQQLGCTDEEFYRRPVPVSPPEDYSLMRKELEAEAERERLRRMQKWESHSLIPEVKKLQEATAALGEAHEGPEWDKVEGMRDDLEVRVAKLATGQDATSPANLEYLEKAKELTHVQRVERLVRDLEAMKAGVMPVEIKPPVKQAPESTPATDSIMVPIECKQEEATIALQPPLSPSFPAVFTPQHLQLDHLMTADHTRGSTCQLLRSWDLAGINVHYFLENRNRAHLYLPFLYSKRTKVYRDFICCTQRPKVVHRWGSCASIHIKTNIPKRSDIMYRFLVEGYNYGTNSIIHSDIAGYTHRKWSKLGKGAMEEAGWPAGWDSDMANDYTNGCTIGQYYTSDGFVAIELQSQSFFCVGFSVSAWLVVHEFGCGFELTASIHHQDARL
eukprot:Sspe_Gene.93416::Locus_66057_Transcript_1_1_Confidence_1.000_Length_1677::g.93416::m.93416